MYLSTIGLFWLGSKDDICVKVECKITAQILASKQNTLPIVWSNASQLQFLSDSDVKLQKLRDKLIVSFHTIELKYSLKCWIRLHYTQTIPLGI